MSTYVDVETSAEALQEDKEVIEAIEKLGKVAAVAARQEFQPEIDAVFSTFESWSAYLFPMLVEYRENHNRIWEDLEKLALFAVLCFLSFLFLSPWRGITQQRKRQNHRWYKQQESSSSLNMSPGGSESDSRSLSTTEDEFDEVQQFQKQWPTIAASRYSALVLPPSCKYVEQIRAVSGSVDHDSMSVLKSSSANVIHVEDNPAQRLQTYWQHFRSFFGKLLTFDYTGAGTALMVWIQGIRQSRQTNLDDDDNETTVSLASRVSEATETLPTTVTVETPTHSTKNPVISVQSVMNGIAPSMEDHSALPVKVGYHTKQPSDLSTVFSDSLFDSGETDSKDHTPIPLHQSLPPPSPVLPQRTSSITSVGRKKDALDAYRVPPRQAASPNRGQFSTNENDSKDKSVEKISDLLPEVPPLFCPESDSDQRKSMKHFFDPATTRDSLKKFQVDMGIPDSNGYVLGDDHLPNKTCTPLLVFVNSRAGPQQGHLLITQLRRLLNPIQIWDLAKGSPDRVLRSFSRLSRLKILVCGGDGTVAWIVSALETLDLKRKWPPIAILPLGTGNDLARIHGWGGGYNNESLTGILEQISESYVSLLDRWEVTIDRGKKKKVQRKSFFNYLGVGADAQAALQVHYLRESKPEWFFSRLVNKAWYGVFGAEDILKATSVNVRKDITLIADGVQVPLPADSQGIIILNIDSYAGGVPLWSHGTKGSKFNSPLMPALEQLPRRSSREEILGDILPETARGRPRLDSMDDLNLLSDEDRYAHVTACNLPSSCQDGMLEIVSIRGAFHLGQIKVGLSNAQRLCQCREATVHLRHKMAVQVDGEPWRQPASTLVVKRKQHPASMLHRSSDDGGVETVMSQLLDWAEERKLVDPEVHAIFMKEFSRRLESHMRQKRTREHDGGLLSMQKLKRAMGSSVSVPTAVNQ